MNIRENIKQGIESIRSNALRAVITSLIIAIGITALVGILTAIDGMKAAISQTFTRMGSQSFNIRNSSTVTRHGGPGTFIDYKPITFTQAKAFKDQFSFPSRISISKNADMTAKGRFKDKETNPNLSVIGIDENYLITSGYEIKMGRNLTEIIRCV